MSVESRTPDELSFPLIQGGIAGAVAYVMGYAITYIWKGGEYQEALQNIQPIVRFFGAETPPAWQIIGWLFYSGHFIESRIVIGPLTEYVNLIQSGEGNLELLYVLPPLLLVVAGFIVAWRAGDLWSMFDGVKAGASVVVGYLTLVVVGTLLFQVGESGPTLASSVLIAGVLYPVVFGGIGGALAQQIR